MLPAQHPWPHAPERPAASADEVHVWRVRLDQDEAALRKLSALLAEDEMQRAGGFHFQRDHDHFVAARGALRDILGRYTGLAPRLLRFTYEKHGKPALSPETGGRLLRFNLAHSHGLALCAVTLGRAVGVDLELVKEEFAGIEIAERFFSPHEVAALRALAPGERATAFFDCWTRKEAYIKARGEGLSHPLHSFAVSLTPGEPAALLCTDDDPPEAARWSMLALSPGGPYRAALAVEGTPPSTRCWNWPGL
ncbi:MAG: 4'-phosphopantetheinyl transferase superfamily protein [Acidobacteria bacterium]|nr:4'-phosphopantetheinyl transferase superfamily protein [Acidobacteriota bacterium]